MKKILAGIFLLGLSLANQAMAELPNIDRTDKVHERRYLDSMNVFNRRVIRVNQSGFRPQDNKYAYVADPSAQTFKVVDANTKKDVISAKNLTLADANAPKPNFWVAGVLKAGNDNTLYSFSLADSATAVAGTEALYKADFSELATIGEYFVVCGGDTSATFHVHPSIFNSVLEYSLQFFGSQRCGNTKSHTHAACHLKDGSKIGHDLTGGWHDCGDHFKVSETLGFAAYVLITTYLVYQDKAEDRYGNSYADTAITDGIPDLLYEAKIGADFIFKLYKASKADGLIAKGDMYHSVGVDQVDHEYWDVPEKQDAQPHSKGGPDRDVADSAGNVSGMYAAVLAEVAAAWYVFDPVYADSLLEAAKDIYANVVKKSYLNVTGKLKGFYTGSSNITNRTDNAAAAALALWYATADPTYQNDLYKDLTINDNSTNYGYNNEPDDAGPYFKGGYLGLTSGFYPGGWMTDYENIHAHVLFSFVKLILKDQETAASYGVGELERDTLIQRSTNSLRRLTDDGSEGTPRFTNRFGAVKAVPPYNLIWTSSGWGLNRYNLGAANAIFMLSEITTGQEKDVYKQLALDNIYYSLGANPWDVSFLMGAGDKNLNHPHNRAANPDGYNAGGMPYKYTCPLGALMGGTFPDAVLQDYWEFWTVTETCIDFSAQLLIPAQSLAETLPEDAEGPLYSNVAGVPISNTSATISWDANEVALTTVFYNTTPDASTAKSVTQTTASKGGALTIDGLEPNQTYYFFLEGMDVKHNIGTDDNHGQWYQFTMTPLNTTISGVTICQVDNRSAKIYWWSSDRLNGIVNYGTSSSNLTESQPAEGGAVLFHEVLLTNLSAGTTYYFSVSSGATTDNNGGNYYSFTTEQYSTYADLDIYIKPTSYQAECTDWKDCHEFIVSIANNDTMAFHDFEIRLYLGKSSTFQPISWAPLTQNWGGEGTMTSIKSISFGSPTLEKDQYYIPITIGDTLKVSGQMLFQLKFMTGTFKDFTEGWSLVAHNAEDDPEQFEGIDLTQAPYFSNSETTLIEVNSKGERVPAFTRDPYVVVYYHGKHIYGYGPDYTPETGPQMPRTVSLNFTSPFVTPHSSLETTDSNITYIGGSRVSPTGFLDDFEMNALSIIDFVEFPSASRKDSLSFNFPYKAQYGNNYYEWVSWHNHAANMSSTNKYDCACAVVRTNVEVDTITTPPEQRHLRFTVDTVKFYTGKMVEVHVQLLDSNMALLDTDPLTVLVTSESGYAKFFTSPTSADPVEKIDIINGEGVFYVSSETATTTILKALGNNTAKYTYSPATAVLIIEELPPWPIIDVAKMVDTDCDDIPDAFDITLSNEYVATEGQSFNAIKFVYRGDTLSSTNVIAQNGKQLVVGAGINDTTINTNPVGFISLISNTQEGVKAAEDFYQDGMPPNLVSVSVLERLNDATSDFVYIQFSEPIKTPAEWPLKVNSAEIAPTVKNVRLYNDSLNIWEFEIAFDAGGGSLITEGMTVELIPTTPIRDLAGNELGSCTPKQVTVLLKIRPIPMVSALIDDKDEDGIAEYAEVEFMQAVDAKHMPDSLTLIFGSATPETLTVEKSALQFSADAKSLHLTLAKPFALGNTNGPYDGEVNGKALVGAGLAVQHLGAGAAYESNSIYAEDHVGPVFVSASLQNTGLNNLTLFISEPVQTIDSMRTLFLRERDDLAVNKDNVYRWVQKSMTLNAIDTSSEFIMEGDRARFAPKAQSAFADMSGNSPATNNPWVTIGSEGTPEITFNVYVKSAVSNINSSIATATDKDPTMRLFIKNQASGKLDLIDTKTGLVLQKGIDTTVAPLTGAVWVFDLTVPRGAAKNEPAAWKSLQIKYDMPIYTNLGTFVNRISGNYDVTPEAYLSDNNKVTLYVEWTNTQNTGVRSKDGKAVGTGAYIYKAELKTKFIPSTTKDAKTQERFSAKDSYDKTRTFGIKRIK